MVEFLFERSDIQVDRQHSLLHEDLLHVMAVAVKYAAARADAAPGCASPSTLTKIVEIEMWRARNGRVRWRIRRFPEEPHSILEGEGRKVPQTDEERLAAFRTIVAYTGIYRVEGDKWVTKVDTSWNPAWNGTEQVRTFKLEGDRLYVTSMWQPNANLGGKTARGVLTWVREK